MQEQLKPCPFCGGNDLKIMQSGVPFGQYSVCCQQCGAAGPEWGSANVAIEKWNQHFNSDEQRNVDVGKMKDEINELQRKSQQFEAQANWLAARLVDACTDHWDCRNCTRFEEPDCNKKTSIDDWREAARKAVKENE